MENGLTYGNKIFVEIKKSLNNIVITVEDDGPGIPKNEHANVFKPFYRIDKSRSLNKSGVGLGLSIAREIINHNYETFLIGRNFSSLRKLSEDAGKYLGEKNPDKAAVHWWPLGYTPMKGWSW